MFKLLSKCLDILSKKWDTLGKRASARMNDQVFLIVTVAILQQTAFIISILVVHVITTK